VKVCSVVGFPLGANTSTMKASETGKAVEDGADEIDMVINVGALKDKDYGFVESDIKAVVSSANGRVVKVIIETCLLEKSEIVEACGIARKAGAHFVKTSTGFGGGGATPEDVALMKKTVGEDLQVKASGGIKTFADAEKLIAAGAGRLGASAGAAIMKELEKVKE
jgi:deoxyribose-phosphate aldolase